MNSIGLPWPPSIAAFRVEDSPKGRCRSKARDHKCCEHLRRKNGTKPGAELVKNGARSTLWLCQNSYSIENGH